MSRFVDWIHRRCPPAISSLHAILAQRVFPNRRRRRSAALLQAAGNPRHILQGPFRGMRYLPFAPDRGHLTRMLGTYERELHPAVEDLCRREPDVVLVAGSGEGYYAVGLARRLPTTRIVAFDSVRWANHLLRGLARDNGVAERVQVEGHCTVNELRVHLAAARFPAVVCDVEGDESRLLDPDQAADLRRAAILVELHDEPEGPITTTLRQRFDKTHDIQEIGLQRRQLSDLPPPAQSSESYLDLIEEHLVRGVSQRWFYMRPRRAAG